MKFMGLFECINTVVVSVSVDISFGQSWCLMWKTSLLQYLKIAPQKTRTMADYNFWWRNLEWRNFNEIITHGPCAIDSSWNYTLHSLCCRCGFFGFNSVFLLLCLFVHGGDKVWPAHKDHTKCTHGIKIQYIPLLQISQGVEPHLIAVLVQLNGWVPGHHHFSNPIAMALVPNEWLPKLCVEFHWWSQGVIDWL